MANMTTLQILQGVHDWVLDKIDEETANFITKTVNDLVNYYTKSETYTKAEVQQIVDAIKQFTYEVVQVLPTASASTMNKIYLVPAPKSEDKNVKEEYITIQDGSTYSWEMLGTTSIDLSNYYTKGQTDSAISSALSSALASYTTTADLTTLLSQKQDVIQDLADIRSGASAGSTAVQPSTLNDAVKNVVAESGVYDVSANNDNTKFESLSALLSSANLNTLIPTDIRKGGMSIKFVRTSDNKYVRFDYLLSDVSTAATFTNVNNWQCVTSEIEELKDEISFDDISVSWEQGSLNSNHVFISISTRILAIIPAYKITININGEYKYSIHEYSEVFSTIRTIDGSSWIKQTAWMTENDTYSPSQNAKTLIIIVAKSLDGEIVPSEGNSAIDVVVRSRIDDLEEIALAALDAIGDPDTTPTEESIELVRSGGVWEAIRNNGKGAFDISAYKAVGGVLAKFDNLAQALGTDGVNVPTAARQSGMSVCFVLNSDNYNYVQYRYLLEDATTNSKFTNVANWQGVDDKPTAGSDNLVKSGGVYEPISSLGERCEQIGEYSETITTKASVGQWGTDGTIYTNPSRRAHLLVQAKNCTRMVLVIPNGWYAAPFYVNDDNSSYAPVISGWQEGTYETVVDGVHNIMLNIKYGSDGETQITQQIADSADWDIILYYVGIEGYYPAASYEEFSELEERVEALEDKSTDIPLDVVLDKCVIKTESGEVENLDLKPSFSLGGVEYGTTGDVRLYARFSWKQYSKFIITIPSDWYIAVQYCDKDWVTKTNTGWTTQREFLINEYTNIQITLKDDNASHHSITIERLNALTVTSVNSVLDIDYVPAAPYYELQELKERLPEYSKTYKGEKININNGYNLVEYGSYPNGVNPTQGFAIYGDYCVQGSSTESGGSTMACLINLSSRVKIADILLSHSGYSAIHCNMMCFGNETIENGVMPLLYASQWDGEECCFVYDIQLDGTSTLKQIISPANLTRDGIKFGVGYVDWLVDTDHNWLFAISYKNSGYSLGGQIVTKFVLPKISDGALVELTDNDIIEYNDFGNYIIRQDGCYNGNRLYLIYGSTGSYVPYLALHVIDVFTLKEVSTIDLQYINKELEGLDVYEGNLVLHTINANILQKFVF